MRRFLSLAAAALCLSFVGHTGEGFPPDVYRIDRSGFFDVIVAVEPTMVSEGMGGLIPYLVVQSGAGTFTAEATKEWPNLVLMHVPVRAPGTVTVGASEGEGQYVLIVKESELSITEL